MGSSGGAPRRRTGLLKLLLAVLAAAVVAPTSCAAGGKAARRALLEDYVQAAIVNGNPARRGRYPWMVSLRENVKNYPHFCGGTLITRQIVLTAAHCFYDENGKLDYNLLLPKVHIGRYEKYGGGQYEARNAADTWIHEGYDPATQANDIALVLLNRPSNKPRIRLAPGKPAPAIKAGKMLTAVGWGTLEADRVEFPKVLQQVKLKLLRLSTCKTFMPGEQWSSGTMLCAGDPKLRRDACLGDSGGPLFLQDPKGRPGRDIQAGIVSFGYGCAAGKPGVFTNVRKMHPWIHATAQKLMASRPHRSRGLLEAQGLHLNATST